MLMHRLLSVHIQGILDLIWGGRFPFKDGNCDESRENLRTAEHGHISA